MNWGANAAIIVNGLFVILSVSFLAGLWGDVIRSLRSQDDRQTAGTIAANVLWLAVPAVILAASMIGLSIGLAALS